ncbi:hypothetical protein QEH56_17825 [Pelagicoccus enzymogenes]|uniref:hypothetical protein n=1 Tax=Pelagicoccus enzymogenes TaxID=2773457 RepID=UPI00280D91D2|nr:hypothetical protein [Pelagicoccus enzymogenes]MDQ8200028.1 hypothetical protein [Pelagicoccus enzymogenes]
MAERLSRRMVLLAAYEDFTRRESVSLRDENFELLAKLQDKKAKVIAQLHALPEQPDGAEAADFNARVAKLLEQEEANSKLLQEKMAVNRQELRKLSQNAVSANKLRRAYAAPSDRPPLPRNLKGRA